MELIVLLAIGIVIGIPVIAIVALVRSRAAERRIEESWYKISDLQGEMSGLRLEFTRPSDRVTELEASVVPPLAAHAHRKLPYRFHLLANPDLINAFALPGGHVLVGLGLLHQMTSEDELACVLGHEFEPIDHYNAAECIQIVAQLKKINLDAIAMLAQIPLEFWQAGYSKEQELEADREGLRLAAAVGYSPQGAVNLFERWAELHREYVTHASTPVDELSQVAIEGLQGYFRSHPLPEERLEQAKKVIAEDGLDATRQLTPLAVSSLLQTKRSLDKATKIAGDTQFGRWVRLG